MIDALDANGEMAGALLYSRDGEFVESHIARDSRLGSFGTVAGSRWRHFEFKTHEPLLDEEPNESRTYTYPGLIRFSGSRLLIATPAWDITRALLRESRLGEPPAQFRRVVVDVQSLVSDCSLTSIPFSLLQVHASTPGYGDSLRNVSFYGEDLGDAEWFRNALDVLSCNSCVARPAGATHGQVRLWRSGSIGFHF